MRTVMLTARRAFVLRGRSVQAGEVFEALPVDAAVLTYRRHADFAPAGATSTASPASVVPAASSSSLPADLPPAAASPAEPLKPRRRRRTYRRRDLVPEDSS